MIKCLFTGQVNSGKSSLIMSLAKYNSNKQVLVSHAGSEENHKVAYLEQEKVSRNAYTTDNITHYIFLLGCKGKYYKYDMIDSVGLIDDVYDKPELRDSLWQLFYQLSKCDILVHTINAYQYSNNYGLNMLDIEKEIIEYQRKKNNKSIICATFADKKSAKKGVKQIRKAYPQIPVIALSNDNGLGVKRLNRLLTEYSTNF